MNPFATAYTTKTYPIERYGIQAVLDPRRIRLANLGSQWELDRAIFDARMKVLTEIYRNDMRPVLGPGRERVEVVVRVTRDAVSDEVGPVYDIPPYLADVTTVSSDHEAGWWES